MRRIVVTEFLSLDAVMEDPGGWESTPFGGWTFTFPDADGIPYTLDEIFAHDAMLLGRVTYEGFAEAWPGRTDDVGFADRMIAWPKYVVSRPLDKATRNNSSVIASNVAEQIARLTQAPGQRHPGRGQPHAGPIPDGRRPGQRVAPDGLSHRARGRRAPVRPGACEPDPPPRRDPAARRGRGDPDLYTPPGRLDAMRACPAARVLSCTNTTRADRVDARPARTKGDQDADA